MIILVWSLSSLPPFSSSFFLFIWRMWLTRLPLDDTVDLMVWSAAELCLTLLCIAIPVLRPLYQVIRGRGSSAAGYYPSSSRDQKSSQNFPMNNVRSKNKVYPGRDVMPTETSVHRSRGDNDSDESILGPEYRQKGIQTTTQVTVSYNNKSKSDLRDYW